MNVYTIPLNFELPIFNTNLSPVEYLKTIPIWANNIKTNPHVASHFKLNWEAHLSVQLNQFFLDHDLKIIWCEIFYKEPNLVSRIHADDETIGDISKMNWVFGGEDSEMHWYTIKDSYYTKSENEHVLHSSLGFKAYIFKPEHVSLAYSENIRGPILIQAGAPHNITTRSQERWCLSIVYRNKLGQRPTMSEAKDIFKKYLI
jgi:hypothetical protein